jgi:hypothetical protein
MYGGASPCEGTPPSNDEDHDEEEERHASKDDNQPQTLTWAILLPLQ